MIETRIAPIWGRGEGGRLHPHLTLILLLLCAASASAVLAPVSVAPSHERASTKPHLPPSAHCNSTIADCLLRSTDGSAAPSERASKTRGSNALASPDWHDPAPQVHESCASYASQLWSEPPVRQPPSGVHAGASVVPAEVSLVRHAQALRSSPPGIPTQGLRRQSPGQWRHPRPSIPTAV